jgi:hypothetical protein
MRTELGKELYQLLLESEMSFIGSGEKNIKEIYKSVQEKYPLQCEDIYLCSHHCKSGNDQPEWKHIVRNALQVLKKNGKVTSTAWGYWMFPKITKVGNVTTFEIPVVKKESSFTKFLNRFFRPWF